MIEVRELTKRYGPTLAVDDLSFTVPAGHVTALLGPNGSGKSTTMRMVLGLDAPTAGVATVAGRRYVDLPAPLREVGALLDARAVHPGRRAADHLLALARSNGIGRRRVGEVLDEVGLAEVAGRRAGTFSLGMSQRLGMAAALLGDPGALLLDEPVNGLDVEGITWIRSLLAGLATEGRAVLVSSHLLREVELVADRVVVVGRGRLLAETTVDAFVAAHSSAAVVVRTSDDAALLVEVEAAGGSVVDGIVTRLTVEAVGAAAWRAGVVVHELRPVTSSLEDAYLDATEADVEYRAVGR